jgi:hypothetical protein
MGKHFAHETCELGFRFRRDYGIIHGAATSLLGLFLQVGILPKDDGRLQHFSHRFCPSTHQTLKNG